VEHVRGAAYQLRARASVKTETRQRDVSGHGSHPFTHVVPCASPVEASDDLLQPCARHGGVVGADEAGDLRRCVGQQLGQQLLADEAGDARQQDRRVLRMTGRSRLPRHSARTRSVSGCRRIDEIDLGAIASRPRGR